MDCKCFDQHRFCAQTVSLKPLLYQNLTLTFDSPRIPLGENIHSRAGAVSNGTYIGFLVLTFTGACLAQTLTNASDVVRSDGSRVILMKHPSWRSELTGLFSVLRTDPWIVFLFPMFLSSNWFYTYQFNDVNAARFNIRTRSLNSVLYYTSQIAGAYVFGYALDSKRFRRGMKARIVWGVLLVLTFAVWGGGYAYQKQYTRAETKPKTAYRMDWTDKGYVGPMFLYMFYGFYDGTSPRPSITPLSSAHPAKHPTKQQYTGSWAPSPIRPANWLSSRVSTRVSNPLVKPSPSASTPWGNRS